MTPRRSRRPAGVVNPRTFEIGALVYHAKLQKTGTVLPSNAAAGMFVGAHETVVRFHVDGIPVIVPTCELDSLVHDDGQAS